MSEWKEYPLDEIYTISSGLSKPGSEFGFGSPFLSFKEIYANRKVPEKLTELVNSSERDKERCSIKRGDVFLLRTSENVEELGLSSVSLCNYEDATFNGFAKRLRPKEKDIILPEYAMYLFCSWNVRKQIVSFASITTRSSLNNDIIQSIKIRIPKISIQKPIASILFNLDSKIDLLRRQNQTLENIAQALFKRWFIDFEFPDENGNPYKSSGGKMVDSELGKIPEGWRVGIIKDIGNVITGKTPSSNNPEHFGHSLPFITPTDFKNYGKVILASDRGISDIGKRFYSKYIIPNNSVIVTCIGSDMGKVAITATHCITNQQINSVILDNSYMCLEYLYQYLKWNYCFLRNIALGGSTMPIINKSTFECIDIIMPSKNIIVIFENISNVVNRKIINNSKQIQTLIKTRDTLLPKLMSGQIRVTGL